LVVFGFLLACFLINNAFAVQYTLTDNISNRNISGGYWNGGTFLVNGEFATFCLERDEFFNWNTPYNGTISGIAMGGGWNTNDGDPLDNKTAWLYTQFLNGVLGITDNEKIALQLAIWKIEYEFGNPNVTNFVYNGYEFLGDVILNQANNYYNLSLEYFDFIGNIMVLNLYDDSGTLKQSQLIHVPEPSTLLLLGIGLIGFGILGRKKFRTKP
jgi:hypothetical protein